MNKKVGIFLSSIALMTGGLGWYCISPHLEDVTVQNVKQLNSGVLTSLTRVVSSDPAVRVTDQYGKAVAGADISIEYTDSDGAKSSWFETADSNGTIAAREKYGTYIYSILQSPDGYKVSDTRVVSKVSASNNGTNNSIIIIKDDGSVRDDATAQAVTTPKASTSTVQAHQEDSAVTRVQAKINALNRTIKAKDEAEILAARSAYNALNASQKMEVGTQTAQILFKAEAAMSAIQADQKAADAVITQFKAIGTVTDYAQSSKVLAARNAYDALTDNQKSLVSSSDLKILSTAEDALSVLAKDQATADNVTAMINKIGTVTTLDQEESVQTARNLYDALSDLQKAKITDKDYQALLTAEAQIRTLKNDRTMAAALTQAITDLGQVTSYSQKDDVSAVQTSYDVLTDAQKALVPKESVEILKSATARIEQMKTDNAAADSFTKMIEALGNVTAYDQAPSVAAARAAYDKLTQTQTALVDNTTYLKLTKAEAKIAELKPAADKAAAEKAAAEKAAADKAAADKAAAEKAAADAAAQQAAAAQAAAASSVGATSSDGKPNVAAGDIEGWRPWVIKALEANGLTATDDRVGKVLRQIESESGGDQNIIQGIIDVNSGWVLPYAHCAKCATGDGQSYNIAHGLMQTIITTFEAYKFEGHDDIFNGYDNLLAAINYAKQTYGSDLDGLGEGHGY